jgi:hypothetical protein
MDGYALAVWIVRLAFLALLYVFLAAVTRILLRDLRGAAVGRASSLGRLVVVASDVAEPTAGQAFALGAVAPIGRDVNNAIVVDDSFASAEHAVLTFRGRTWYVEDLASTNGTFVNGLRVAGLAAIGFGDEVQVGRVRFRLERPPA